MTNKEWQEKSGEKLTADTLTFRIEDLLTRATDSGVTLDQQENVLSLALENVSRRKHGS